MKRSINTGFRTKSDADFQKQASVIVASIAENVAIFADPVPSVADLQATEAKYNDALLKADNRGRFEVMEKNIARINLEELLKRLGMYVMNTANGDGGILTLSGFTLRKLNELRHIGTPESITVTNGVAPGSLAVSVKAEAGASVYVHEYTDNYQGDATVWISVSTASAKYVHSNLKPGQQYWFRVGVGGARGQFTYSPVASKFAQ